MEEELIEKIALYTRLMGIKQNKVTKLKTNILPTELSGLDRMRCLVHY